MPGFQQHLAIASQYIKKNPDKFKSDADILDFNTGSIMVDILKGRGENSHYGDRTESVGILQFNRDKINIRAFLETKPEMTPYNRGYLLHLYTDYEFYNSLLSDYFETSGVTDFEQYRDDLTYTYGVIHPHLLSNYAIDLNMTHVKDLATIVNDLENTNSKTGTLQYTNDQHDKFIDHISSVNLDDLVNKMLKSN